MKMLKAKYEEIKMAKVYVAQKERESKKKKEPEKSKAEEVV